ncbi:hypothetical protein GCM10010279_69410 [Streptomyces mutabilis]|nr:hypothetical protein GCM10010279_69410 [Streptomyces mutabilis]
MSPARLSLLRADSSARRPTSAVGGSLRFICLLAVPLFRHGDLAQLLPPPGGADGTSGTLPGTINSRSTPSRSVNVTTPFHALGLPGRPPSHAI